MTWKANKMDYDNLKECANCGKYTTSLSATSYCPRCQQIEDYVPDFSMAYCPNCEHRGAPFFEGDIYVCELCGEEIDF